MSLPSVSPVASERTSAYIFTGEADRKPAVGEMLMSLWFYGDATGVFSSRKPERASCDSIAFRYSVASPHPDHITHATFSTRLLEQAAVSADPAVS